MDSLQLSRWDSVQRRDKSADGVFVYAVTTTGVCCRPGCSSRTPRRENVAFYSTFDEAHRDGYRACRRCRPDDDRGHDASLAAVISLCRRLETGDAPDLAAMASDLGYSERHLRRRFRDVVGVSVCTYARSQKAERARAVLASHAAVAEVVYEAGYGSSRAYYEHATSHLGMTPRAYQGGGDGEHISFTLIETPLGIVLAARTARGVCAVRIGTDVASLVEGLAAEFPLARLQRDDGGLVDVASLIALAVRGHGETTALPLDLQGTAFQVRVWEALRHVPRGTTLTYSELAERIGSPRAVRAVGSACGANPVALVIPCHRIVRRDGSLGGYRWGLDVKEALLAAETTSP